MESEFAAAASEFQESIELFKAYAAQCHASNEYNIAIMKHFRKNLESKASLIVCTLEDNIEAKAIETGS